MKWAFLLSGLCVVSFCASPSTHHASAHDYWNGKNCAEGHQNAAECKVPDWVKSSCCGPADAHHLEPAQVHGPFAKNEGPKAGYPNDYYMIDGYPWPVDADKAIPSQDGDYWIFYSANLGGHPSGVYCFFVPFAG